LTKAQLNSGLGILIFYSFYLSFKSKTR